MESEDESHRSTIGRIWAEEQSILLLLLVAFVGYSVYWHGSTIDGGDTSDYQAAAQAIGAGWHEILDRVPGYPLILLITGADHGESSVLFFLQLASHLLAVLLVVRTARRLAVRDSLRMVLAVMLLLPPVVIHAITIGTEGTAELLLVAIIWLFVRWQDDRINHQLVAIGLLAGAAAWVRPTFTLLFVPIAIITGIASADVSLAKRFRIVMLAVLPAVLLVGLLVGINATRFSYPTVTPLFGWNLSTRTSSFVERLPPSEEPIRSQLVEARNKELVSDQTHTALMYIWTVRPELEKNSGMSQRELDQHMVKLNLGLIARNPLTYSRAVAAAASTYILFGERPDGVLNSGPAQLLWAAVHYLILAIFVVQLSVVAGLGLLKRVPRRTGHALLLCYGLALYNAAISTLFEVGNTRYRFPTDAILLLALFVGLELWSHVREEVRRDTAAVAVS